MAVVLALSVAPANADVFSSDTFNFSADFPTPPEKQGPFDDPPAANGPPGSTTFVFLSGRAHHYAAVVAVETFRKGEPIDAQQTLASERDAAMQGRVLQSSEPMTVHRNPALHFFFANPGDHSAGEGISVVVAGERPRAYVVLAEYSDDATREEVVAINRFVRSFRLTE